MQNTQLNIINNK